MGTTPNAALPYPEGTDLVMDGDDAIKALATALDTNTLIRMSSKPVAADPDSAYPLGWSFMYLTGTESAAGGWPQPGNFWRVFTFKVSANNTFQYLVRATASVSTVLYRNYASGAWSPWSGNGPFAKASGIASFGTVTAGSSKSVAVTYPANRFTQVPVTLASAITGTPHARNASTSPGGTTGVNVYFGNSGSSDVTDAQAYWAAEQASSSSGGFSTFAALADAGPDSTVTCPTEGCENEGIAIPVNSTWTDDDGVEHPMDGFECGPCGTNLTDTLTSAG